MRISHSTFRLGYSSCWAGLFSLLFGMLALMGQARAQQGPGHELPLSQDSQPSLLAPVERSEPTTAPVGPMTHPQGPGPMQWRLGVGLELEILPLVLMESEFRYLPSADVAFEFGLPHGFGIEAEATVLVVDNHLAVGPSWSVITGPVTWGVRDLLGLTFGWIGISAFDSLAWGLSNEPGFTVGVGIDDSYVTLNVDITLIHRQEFRIGDWGVVHTGFYWAGLDSGLTVETPVGGGMISYGLELSYAEPDQLLWFAFSDNPTKLLITRFKASYVF